MNDLIERFKKKFNTSELVWKIDGSRATQDVKELLNLFEQQNKELIELKEKVVETGMLESTIFPSVTREMTVTLAQQIRKLRVDKDHTWNKIAEIMYSVWINPDWEPPTNQLAGSELCFWAARKLKEDPNLPLWNVE